MKSRTCGVGIRTSNSWEHRVGIRTILLFRVQFRQWRRLTSVTQSISFCNSTILALVDSISIWPPCPVEFRFSAKKQTVASEATGPYIYIRTDLAHSLIDKDTDAEANTNNEQNRERHVVFLTSLDVFVDNRLCIEVRVQRKWDSKRSIDAFSGLSRSFRLCWSRKGSCYDSMMSNHDLFKRHHPSTLKNLSRGSLHTFHGQTCGDFKTS